MNDIDYDHSPGDVLITKQNGNNNSTELESVINKENCKGFHEKGRINQVGLELCFQHVCLEIKGKKILKDVSGLAKPGEILAVMGPSGSGKTSLLNVLGGRMPSADYIATIGGQPLTKKTRRKISYVLQEDIFFPNLTLHDTLLFAAELRLPQNLSHKVKKEIVDDIVTQLDINKSMNTIIGNAMVRGLSGGEKKRANIANELLTDPAVLLLDEPTSGLDSTTAFDLVYSLKQYAVNNNKTVVMSVHQPSSQMFFLFNKIILLSGGQITYQGEPGNVLNYFEDLGQKCTIPHYNPADFILDMAKSDENTLKRFVSAANQNRMENTECPILLSTLMNERASSKNSVVVKNEGNLVIDSNNRDEEILNNDLLLKPGVHRNSIVSYSNRSVASDKDNKKHKKWTTTFMKQFIVLTHRSYLQGKSRFKEKLTYIKTIGVALICGLVWWQIGRGQPFDNVIPDIGAVLFFISLYNSFNPLFEVLQLFPSERVVINKERMAGSYRLSAYYFAKLASEIPFTVTMPTINFFIVYWMAGLNGFNNGWSFIGSWAVMLFIAIASQSIGIFASAITMDFNQSLVLGILIMISFILLGGFYVKNIPPWLDWLRYCSPITHAWSLLLYLEFNSNTRFMCRESGSLFPSCERNATILSGNVTETLYVKATDVYDYNLAGIPAAYCLIALLTITIFFRAIGYISLRFFHKPMIK